jgi:hypothetical protein
MSAGEECDDAGETDACNGNCSKASCGDGIINASFVVDVEASADDLIGEQCDPNTGSENNNRRRATAHSSGCDFDCTLPRCGDQLVNGLAGEECDPDWADPGEIPDSSDACDLGLYAPRMW